jgi:hypothetical protein
LVIVEPDRHPWCAALVCLLAAVPAGKAQAREKATTVAVIGDSIGVGLQNGLYRVVPKSVRLVRLARNNTGLTRNRIYAWPAHVAADVKRYHVDTLVVMLGANDYQRIVVRRRKHRGVAILRPGRAAWSRVYRARVDALIAAALKAGVKRIVWVGLPIVRSPAQDRAYRRLNAIYRAAAAAHPAVDYFPTRGLTARRTKTGALAYHAYVKVGKRYYLFRNTRDGIHFTVFGYRYLARHLWRRALAAAAARK